MLGLLQKREPSAKVKAIKDAIKSGTYDMDKAIKGSVERIVDYPQCLLQK